MPQSNRDVRGDPLIFLSAMNRKARMALFASVVLIGLLMGLVSAFLLIELIGSLTEPGRSHRSHELLPIQSFTTTPASPNPSVSVAAITRPAGTPGPSPVLSDSLTEIPDVPSKNYRIEGIIENGIYYYRLKEYKRAEEEFRKVLAFDHRYNEAYLYLGQCREKQHDPTGALEAYRAYLRGTARNRERIVSIAQMAEKEKEYEKALELYKLALNDHPDAKGCYAVASCYFRKGDYENAISYLKSGLGIEKHHYPSQLLLGQSYRKVNRPAEALRAYKAAYKIRPRDVMLLYQMGEISFEMGDYANARGYLEEYTAREGDTEAKNRGFDLLKTVMYRSQQKIPSIVERQTDEIPGMELVRVVKNGAAYKAILAMNGRDEEFAEGDSVMNKYSVLDINRSRVVLRFQDTYYVLRPR